MSHMHNISYLILEHKLAYIIYIINTNKHTNTSYYTWQVAQPAYAVGGVVLTSTVGSTIWATPLEGVSAG